MAESVVVNVEQNNYRNVILRCTLVSDGSGVTDQKIYDATSSGVYYVTQGGQRFYPGIHTKLMKMDFDVDGMRFKLAWEATANSNILTLGASPERFDWTDMGGLRVPAGLVGATGSILCSTIAAAANATLSFVLYLHKGVPQT
jgi:hypothetical protein